MYAQGAASLLNDMSSEFTDMSYSFFNSSVTLQQYLQNPAAYGKNTLLNFSLSLSIMLQRLPMEFILFMLQDLL